MDLVAVWHLLEVRSFSLVTMAMAILAIVIIVISLRRRAEKAVASLRESEERYRLLIINSREMIATHQPDGTYDYVSPTAQALCGYTAKELVGKNWTDFFHPDERDALKQKIQETVLQKKQPLTLEHRFRQKDGNYIWLETAVQPIRDLEKKVMQLQNSSRDISERKRIEQMKDDFISKTSHELRTPLTIIKAAITNLKDGIVGPLTEKQAHVVETTSRNIDRLKKIITDLLDLARIESGKARIVRRPTNVGALIKESVANFKAIANERKIVLKTELLSSLPNFYADPDMIMQVLTNLISNALRFAKTKIVVKAEPMERSMQVSVMDDGPGIPKEDQELLFNRFEQLYRPVGNVEYKGTGLGLAICKEIVDEHRGKIWVESEAGQGARFHFSIPLDLRSSLKVAV